MDGKILLKILGNAWEWLNYVIVYIMNEFKSLGGGEGINFLYEMVLANSVRILPITSKNEAKIK